MDAFLHATYTRARDHALELAALAARERGRCTLMVRSYDETVVVKKMLAAQGGSLGVQVVTLKDWLQDAWELFGNGLLRVDAVQRDLMIRRVLLDAAATMPVEERLSCTPGIVDLVGTVARDALPAALAADCAGFSCSELQVMRALRSYAQLLGQEGLVEDSQVVAHLHEGGYLQGQPVVVLDVPTTAAQDALLASFQAQVVAVSLAQEVWEADQAASAAGSASDQPDQAAELQRLSAALYRPNFQDPVQPQGAVRFAFAAGPYAHDQLAVEQLRDAVDSAMDSAMAVSVTPDAEPSAFPCPACASRPVQVLYVARDPRQRFGDLADRLADQGISSSFRAFVPLRSTDFGRAWITLMDFVNTPGTPGTFTPSQISDFALSAFSFMSLSAARRLDQRIRGWRGQTVDEALTDLAGFQDEDHRDFAAAVAEGNLLEAVELQIKALAAQENWMNAHDQLQLAAARAVQTVMHRAGQWSLPLEQVREELRRVSVPCSGFVQAVGLESGASPRAQVTFATLHRASQEQPASADVLVLDDLTAQDYPLKDDLTATDQIMDRVGAFKPRGRIDRLRRDFQHVLRVPRHRALLMRCLNDSDAQELRPAALLEELVDCYRRDPQNPGEVDKVMGLPSCLLPFSATLGEDQLSQALDPRQPQAQAEGVLVEVPPAGALSFERRQDVLLPGRTSEELLDYPVLSPSAIEKYLQCPYKWFAESRLGAASKIEAGFGPLESGTFAHRVLGLLHERLKSEGLGRVTRENVGYAQDLAEKLFRSELEQEPFRFDAAYVPLTQMEHHQAEALLRNLKSYVEWEADLLPDFLPQYAELELGMEKPIAFAGVHVHGRLDRLDLDPYGRAVVVDYKGGVGKGYSFGAKIAEGGLLPKRVQVLIYAQMARRTLGVVPVGAVYVSYGKRTGIWGAYDRALLHAGNDLQGIAGSECGVQDFGDVLDRVEEELESVLERMKAGHVAPSPCSADACEHCLVASCPARAQA